MDGSIAQYHYFRKIAVGRRIVSVARIFYYHRGIVDDSDGPLELTLDTATVLFDVASDGETAKIEFDRWLDPFPEPLSIENRAYVEACGCWRRMDCSDSWPYSTVRGQLISGVCGLLNEFGHFAGVRIDTSNRSLWFVVKFDEAYVYWEAPDGWMESAL